MRKVTVPADEAIDMLDQWTDIAAKAADTGQPNGLTLAIVRGLETLYAIDGVWPTLSPDLAGAFDRTALRFMEICTPLLAETSWPSWERGRDRLRARMAAD